MRQRVPRRIISEPEERLTGALGILNKIDYDNNAKLSMTHKMIKDIKAEHRGSVNTGYELVYSHQIFILIVRSQFNADLSLRPIDTDRLSQYYLNVYQMILTTHV